MSIPPEKINKKRRAPPSEQRIELYWMERGEFEMYPQSEGVYCWACKGFCKHVERCHIIPHALGGSDEPSNFVLMCSHCHTESPDTIYPELFWKWFYDKMENSIFGLSLDYANKICELTMMYSIKNPADSFTPKEVFSFMKNRQIHHPSRSLADHRKDFLFLFERFLIERSRSNANSS